MSIPSSSVTKLLASDYADIVRSGLVRQVQVMGFNSLGLWIQALDSNGTLRVYVVTDLTVPNGSPGFDQTLPTFIVGNHTTTARHIVAEVVSGGTALNASLVAGSVVKVVDTLGTNQLSVDATGAALVRGPATGLPVAGSVGAMVQVTDSLANNILYTGSVPIIDSFGRLGTSFAAHITTSTTTNVVASTAYLSSLVVTVDVGGAGSTLTVQDKSATPKKLVNALSTAASSITPTNLSFGSQGILMTGGIDIVTAGAAAPTCDVWVTFLQ